MPQISCIEIMDKPEQTVMAIRKNTTGAELPELINESYTQLGEYFEEKKAYLSDMPYVKYFNMDMENLEVEIGFPVKMALPEKGDIKLGTIPAGKFVFGIYKGAYEELEGIYQSIMKYAQENKMELEEISYEFYLNGGDGITPPEEYLTIVEIPVK